MTRGKKAYRYQPLDITSDHVRLVTILPKRMEKSIHLSLEQVSIHHIDGQYEAISYTWEPKLPYRHVMVDGRQLRVGYNIWRFLKHCRDTNLTKARLWIDAICINQDNDAEKNDQVARMGHIFESASRVLIWLGSESERRDASLADLDPKDFETWLDVLRQRDDRSLSLEDQIMSIVYNPYWRRIWILQETALAREVSIIWGAHLLGHDHITTIYLTARENSKPGYRAWVARRNDPIFEDLGTGLLDHHPMCGVRTDPKGAPRKSSLTETIRTYHRARHLCLNPRDQIYGLLGIVNSPDTPVVDYDCTLEELFARTVTCMNNDLADHLSKGNLGLDISVVSNLLRALGVSHTSYLWALKTLSSKKTECLLVHDLKIRLGPVFCFLVPLRNSSPSQRMHHKGVMMVKMGCGQIEHFLQSAPPSEADCEESPDPSTWDIEDTNILLLCWLGIFPTLIIRRHERNHVSIERFVWFDLTRSLAEPVLHIDKALPVDLLNALEKDLNSFGLDWSSAYRGENFDFYFSLSALNLVSLCDLL
ncbi:hypothetical protein H2200_008395 [Cladophialophora chaetospira]|uniref:Heterokaryon incompatibility domain-containing protein n=1 Tax=Cladophialophora chaetospira TaxID=386627 RepID=A0AA38X5V7_9EURO|nr:hypothetical protein H2200_008395 [Cladophialophora chaetospira]